MKKDQKRQEIKYSIWDTATNEEQELTNLVKNDTAAYGQTLDEEKAREDERI
jgi:GTPase SAR1 family protein